MSPKKDGKDRQKPENRRKGIEESEKPGDKQREEEITGVTQGTLRGLGKMIPGFGELVKGLEKSEAFQERLKDLEGDIEKELEKATALKRGPGARKSIIPPRTTPTRGGQVARGGIISPQSAPRTNRAAPKMKPAGVLSPREVIIEILDEGEHLKIIAELPGFAERGIQVQVKDSVLIVTARGQGRRYQEEIKLPCAVNDTTNMTYRNGVLQVILDKRQE